jgi:hypothetical protein
LEMAAPIPRVPPVTTATRAMTSSHYVLPAIGARHVC